MLQEFFGMGNVVQVLTLWIPMISMTEVMNVMKQTISVVTNQPKATEISTIYHLIPTWINTISGCKMQ